MDLIPDGARVLCFSPHPDDTEFGVGATLSKYRGRFAARVVVLSDRSQTRNEQRNDEDQMKAAAMLGLPPDAVRFVDDLGYGVNRFKVRFFGTEENRDLLRLVATRPSRISGRTSSSSRPCARPSRTTRRSPRKSCESRAAVT